MLKFITNMQISRRILLAFLMAAVIPGIMISTLGITFAKKQIAESEMLQTNINAFKSTTATGSSLPTMHYLLNQLYYEQYGSHKVNTQQIQMDLRQLSITSGNFASGIAQFRQDYALASGRSMQSTRQLLADDFADQNLSGRQRQMFNTIQQQLWPGYSSAQNRVTEAISQRAPEATVRSLLDEANKAYMPLQAKWSDLNNITELVNERITSSAGDRSNPWLLVTLLALVVTIAFVTTVGYTIYRTIMIPLHQLAWLTRRIAHGETSARARIDGHDEIYLVASSMNNMLDSIVHLIQEAQAQHEILQEQVEKLVSEVSGVGEGDLRVQAEVTDDMLGMLADSFNYTVEELGSLVVRVKGVASEVEKSTRVVVKRMSQLAENGNRQLAGIGDATEEVEHIAQINSQIAERTQSLYDVARVARLDAQVGRDAAAQMIHEISRITDNVQNTAHKIHSLGERSREINEIVEVISSIAHQTNRLALDAAIQAAMAGENGKGFGAVAADIRRLAERSKDQTALINRIVRAIRSDIRDVAFAMQDTQLVTGVGSRLTMEADTALESVFAAVEHQAHEIECINQLATQQVQSSRHIVQIMQETSETTRQSSDKTRNASQRIEHLARLVEQLRASVEAFKLRENRPYQVMRPMLIPAEGEEHPTTISGVFRAVASSMPQRRFVSTPTASLPGMPPLPSTSPATSSPSMPGIPPYQVTPPPPSMPATSSPLMPAIPPLSSMSPAMSPSSISGIPPYQVTPPPPSMPMAPPETSNGYASCPFAASTSALSSDFKIEPAQRDYLDPDDWATVRRAVTHEPNP